MRLPGFSTLALLVVAIAAATVAFPCLAQPVPVILDTDLGPDADDAGALALIHGLQTVGEAEILAVACGTKSPWCAPAVDAINTYYGRGDIPVGTLKGPGAIGYSEEWYGDSFTGYVAGRFDNDIRHAEYAEDAVAVYRRALAAARDSSVAVVVTGFQSNLQDLLESPGDSIDARTGAELVADKVRLLSVMGGYYPGGSEFNFISDGQAARYVVEHWPTPIMFSGFEIGEDLLTGAPLFDTPEENPVRASYHFWDLHFARQFEPEFDPETGIWPHSSFDQTAVLYAVRGLRDYWTAETTGCNVVLPDGSNRWESEPDCDHAYLIEKMPREELAEIIDELMVLPPP